ncbi:hypothetical protein BVC80_1715g98 [Macleaya cordata]|uniref:NAD(P)-binding domain-containing protein n=1 Tax=Macleaya cordata TaxID=56857 RepID=A0A200Q2A3_MACCD|nr:hypothetical protein BVC80_1715g98 [Macleaya cordata]
MELFSLSSPRITSPLLPSSSSSSRKISIEKHSFVSTLTNNIKIYPDARKLKFLDFRAQASGSVQGSRKSNPGIAKASKQELQSKDNDVVFVAGATGKVGSRTVRELIKLGFQVRAGVRSSQKAEMLVETANNRYYLVFSPAVEKLKIVECDLERDRIEQAIGNASVVICCIGASEKEVLDITGPYRIDYQATKNLIDAATSVGVNHFILVTSLGTNKIGFPAAILNLFWGVLIWKRKAEEALIASGLPYTIVRPGGMERPTDAYKETHNIALAEEDTLFGGQVSNLQVAELMAFMAKNRSLSYCKVVEVIAETTAPLTPMGDLLAKIPSNRVDSFRMKEEPQDTRMPDSVPSQSIVSEASSTVIERESTQTGVQISRPLSPYFTYEDLKPPSSPTPTPSTSLGSTKAKAIDAVEAEPKSSPSNTQMSLSEPTEAVADSKLIQTQPQTTKPLSPYTVYDDLKPLTSPTPTSPGGITGHVNVTQADSDSTTAATQITVEVQKTRPLSPYAAYEDFKPPTSPSPPQATGKDRNVTAAPQVEAVPPVTRDSATTEKTPTQAIEKEFSNILTKKTSHLSPYPVYDDLKPPTSPSPNSRTASLFSQSTTTSAPNISNVPDTNTAQAPTSDELEEKQNISEPKPRPLSPFTIVISVNGAWMVIYEVRSFVTEERGKRFTSEELCYLRLVVHFLAPVGDALSCIRWWVPFPTPVVGALCCVCPLMETSVRDDV